MTEERSAERLVVFVDAVVAIAITLLVLPLADVPRSDEGVPLHAFGDQLALDLQPFLGFTVSFFVVARFWWANHQTFVRVRRWSPPLVAVTVLWLFTIVLLPAVTALAFEYDPKTSPGTVALYIGTMLASSLLLTVLSVIVHVDPSVADDRGIAGRNRVIGGVAASIALLLALLIGTLVPAVNYWAIWLIAVTGPFEWLARRAYRRRDRRLGALSEADATLGTQKEPKGSAPHGSKQSGDSPATGE